MTEMTVPLSPIAVQSNPVNDPPTQLKNKKKGSKILIGLVALLLVLGGAGVYWYFTAGEIAQIAKVGTCNGYFECLEWKKNRDQQDQINANSNQAQYGGYAGGGTGPNSNLGQGNYEGIAQAQKLAKETGVDASAYLNAAKKNEAGTATDAEKKIIADAAAKLLVDAAAAKAEKDRQAAIAAGAKSYADNFDKAKCLATYPGSPCKGNLCEDSGGNWKGDICYFGSSATCEGPLSGIGGDPCAANGGICAGTDVIRCKCGNSWVGGKASAGCSSLCAGAGLNCAGSCEPPADPPPSAPPSTPTMACTGITSTPATPPAPTVGQTLTFTCAGTVTPTTAGTLSYKFRYSINSGTPVSLTPLTATPNKAELTINACGTYKVQCQACATINSVLTCDPIWTAATQ